MHVRMHSPKGKNIFMRHIQGVRVRVSYENTTKLRQYLEATRMGVDACVCLYGPPRSIRYPNNLALRRDDASDIGIYE